jgi:hypothetical protein
METLLEIVSWATSLAGLALLLVSVGQLLTLLCTSACRAGRAWALAARHMRRASAAREAAHRSRERLVRAQQTEAYEWLRLGRRKSS